MKLFIEEFYRRNYTPIDWQRPENRGVTSERCPMSKKSN